ncbi:hypothetical protein ACY3NT_003812 [Enterobacter sichuanensis]
MGIIFLFASQVSDKTRLDVPASKHTLSCEKQAKRHAYINIEVIALN